ncbi:hypothetical protein MNBD_GAMMA14-1907 [hydrothermal vent metagenome]|uniref:Uncharacterized protein n=1 Tax=hydrothermal vent metagenome TaxID=652676 RepID=A0A3B0Z1G6_9ZZZZ
MTPYLLIIIQSVALPFSLSILLLWLVQGKDIYKLAGSVMIWLAMYAWIIQWPELPPGEAVDWLWLLLVAMAATGYMAHRRTRHFLRTTLFLTVVIAIAWPVLRYQPSIIMISELVVIVTIGGFLFNLAEKTRPVTPALNLAIQASGLAIACALSGSLLVGQLSAALAAVTGGYAIPEMLYWKKETRFSTQQILVFLPLYLALLLIARIYAELPITTTLLLLTGLVSSALIPWRHSWAISLLLNTGAIGLVLLNSDSSTYY